MHADARSKGERNDIKPKLKIIAGSHLRSHTASTRLHLELQARQAVRQSREYLVGHPFAWLLAPAWRLRVCLLAKRRFARSSSSRRLRLSPLPARLMKYVSIRIPEPGPLGDTLWEASTRAIVSALFVNKPGGGKVDSVLTPATQRGLLVRFFLDLRWAFDPAIVLLRTDTCAPVSNALVRGHNTADQVAKGEPSGTSLFNTIQVEGTD
jgi:hypothetical protein